MGHPWTESTSVHGHVVCSPGLSPPAHGGAHSWSRAGWVLHAVPHDGLQVRRVSGPLGALWWPHPPAPVDSDTHAGSLSPSQSRPRSLEKPRDSGAVLTEAGHSPSRQMSPKGQVGACRISPGGGTGNGRWPCKGSREPDLLFTVNSSCSLHFLANPDQIRVMIDNPYSNYIKKKKGYSTICQNNFNHVFGS